METKDERSFDLPTINPVAERRKRNKKDGKEEENEDPEKPKLSFFESTKRDIHKKVEDAKSYAHACWSSAQKRYLSLKTYLSGKATKAIGYADARWLGMQKRHAWLKGDEFSDSKYDSRVPLKLYPALDFWQRKKLALQMTFFGTIVLLILWNVFNHVVETSVKLHLLETETQNDARILDLTLTDVHYPTKDVLFDEWAEKTTFPEFSASEFAIQSIISTVFIHASVLFHNNEKTLYNIGMDDMHSVFAQRCNDPNSCGCMSLLQMGIPRNAIYIYDVSIKHYVLMFDPKIKGNDKTNFHRVPWTLDNTLAPQKKQTVYVDVPMHVLVTFKDRNQNGKTNTRQFSNEVAACLYLQLQLKTNYTQLHKTIKEQLQ